MKKILSLFISFFIIFSLSISISESNIDAKESKIEKNKKGQVVKKVHYYSNGNIKQILTYKYFKNGKKKQTISKKYYKNEIMSYYAKYEYSNSKKKNLVYKSKRMIGYNTKGKKLYDKYYRYNVEDVMILDQRTNIYKYKKYDNGVLIYESRTHSYHSDNSKRYKFVVNYSIEKGKSVKYQYISYDYRLDKKNVLDVKRMKYYSNKYVTYESHYNNNGELKSNKNGNAFLYIFNNKDSTVITYKYDKNGKAVYQSGPDPKKVLPS